MFDISKMTLLGFNRDILELEWFRGPIRDFGPENIKTMQSFRFKQNLDNYFRSDFIGI